MPVTMPSAVVEVLETYPEPQRSIALRTRELILGISSMLREEILMGGAVFSAQGPICSIIPQKAHVNLQFFRGAELPDTQGLLEGTGKALRYIKINALSEVEVTRLRPYVQAALVLDQLAV